MLRCAGLLSSTTAHTSAVRLCAAGAMRHGAAAALHPRPLSAVATTRRTFFPPGTPGSDLLRHLTTPAEPTKAFSPLEKLRPPAPPTASDAQPFGSLNRTNQLRRYVNVNTTSSSESNAATAAGSGSSSASNAASVSTGAAASPMDLSRLVRRHTSSNMKSTHTLSDASSATQPHVTAATHGAPSPLPSTSQSAASTHAAVARAQAAIAAAQQHSDALQAEKMAAEQQQRTIASSSKSTQANASTTASTSRGHAGDRGASPARQHSQVYKEHCYIGWSPEEFYRVVADVEHYADFLPWCAGSEVHTTRRVQVPRGRRLLAGNAATTASAAAAGAVGQATAGMALEDATAAAAANAVAAELVDAIEMTATLTIGFSFLKEQYTSRVTLYPGTKIVAALYDEDEVEPGGAGSHAVRAPPPRSHAQDSFVVSLFKKAASTAGAAAKRSILKHLLCEWEFCPVPGKPNTVEVVFSVSFEFKNPLHSHMIMSNVVTLMTRSFERRCESLYGPPSATKESLPLLF